MTRTVAAGPILRAEPRKAGRDGQLRSHVRAAVPRQVRQSRHWRERVPHLCAGVPKPPSPSHPSFPPVAPSTAPDCRPFSFSITLTSSSHRHDFCTRPFSQAALPLFSLSPLSLAITAPFSGDKHFFRQHQPDGSTRPAAASCSQFCCSPCVRALIGDSMRWQGERTAFSVCANESDPLGYANCQNGNCRLTWSCEGSGCFVEARERREAEKKRFLLYPLEDGSMKVTGEGGVEGG
jgi:hypothetical protein